MSEVHAQSVAYVRDTMIDPAPPPDRQAGVVLWLRHNLFSGPVNVVLTLVALWIIYWLVVTSWPWLSHSVWTANSLSECRAIIAQNFGEGATGACWSVIRERWNQYLFGFYPRPIYWRPVLVFGLLIVAVSPVLFSERVAVRRGVLLLSSLAMFMLLYVVSAPVLVITLSLALFIALIVIAELRPNLLLILTVLYPLLAYWLLWGGSLWLPVGVLVGCAAAAFVWRFLTPFSPILAMVAGVLAALIWFFYLLMPAADMMQSIMPVSIRAVDSDQFGGFLLAITIGVAGIVLSLPMGVILALARRSDMILVRWMAIVFIEFIRGVPLISLLFVASLLLNYFLPPGTTFDIILRVIIMVTLFAAAYMAEVIRGGLAALPRGQYEASDSLGLTYWQAQRMIILPQALKISIPGIVSTFIGLFKDTTLVVFVGLFDPLKGISDFVRADFNWKGIYWEPYIFTGAIFFILCFSMSRYSMYLERRLMRGND